MQLLHVVVNESGGKLVLDLDVTAEIRPAYFGASFCGPIFVENRYTDWRKYWPHATLRNFWLLSQYVDPVRLRMELLNNTRNAKQFGDDPLAPQGYSPDYLLASVMFSSPLGWFEMSNLPADYVSKLAPLVRLRKQLRDELFSGTIFPIGEEPSGVSWTGFVSVRPDQSGAILLALREVNDRGEFEFQLPIDGLKRAEVLYGQGSASVLGNRARVSIPRARGYVIVRLGA